MIRALLVLLTMANVNALADGYYMPPEQSNNDQGYDTGNDNMNIQVDQNYYSSQSYMGPMPRANSYACIQCDQAPPVLPYIGGRCGEPRCGRPVWQPRPMHYPYPNNGRCMIMPTRIPGIFVIVIGNQPLMGGPIWRVNQMIGYYRSTGMCWW